MKKLLVVLSALLTSWLTLSADEVSFTLESPSVVALGEEFRVNFTASGDVRFSDFDWNASNDFEVVWGPSTSSSSSIQIINGKRTKSVSKSYSYVLRATKAGRYSLAPASIKADGKSMTSGSKTIEVIASSGASSQGTTQSQGSGQAAASKAQSSGDKLFLKLSVSKNSAVLGEPLTAELKLFTKVNVAGFEGVQFPSFEGFWNKETFVPDQVEFHREQFGGEIYDVATLRKYTLIPQKAGDLTIEPAELVTLVNVRRQSSNSIFDDFFDSGYSQQRYRLTTDRMTIHVKDLPKGAPSTFYGGVGVFSINALLTKDSLAVHEATTLTLVVKGTGNISLVNEPKVTYPLDVEAYEAKTSQNIAKNGQSGMKTYEIPIIPRSAGTFTIEPIPFTYYDSAKGQYVTIHTDPLTLKVARGNNPAADASNGIVSSYSQSESVKTLSKDIRYIATTPGKLTRKGDFFFASSLFTAIVLFIIAAGAIILAALRKRASNRRDVVGTRIKKASKAAKLRLKAAKGYLDQNIQSAFYEELHRALVGYISDKFNVAASDFSKDNVAELLASRSVSDDIIKDFIALLEDCELARYAPSALSGDMQSHYAKAEELISTIDHNMKPLNTSSLKAIIALVILLPGLAANAAAPCDSLFTAGVQAYSEGNYTQAIEAFQAIEDEGYENSTLYCNLASSYYKSGDLAQAVLYYNKALKLDPSNKDAAYNLDIVKGQLRDRIDEVPEFILKTWSNKVCYSLSSNAWSIIFIVFLLVLTASVVVFFLTASTGWKKGTFASAIVSLVLCIISLCYASKIKREYFAMDGAVVIESVVAVKNAPATSGTADLFILHEGATVKVLDVIGGFANIEISDGRSGWIQTSAIEIY